MTLSHKKWFLQSRYYKISPLDIADREKTKTEYSSNWRWELLSKSSKDNTIQDRKACEADQAVAINASFVFGFLKQPPNYHLVSLIFSHPGIHFAKMLQKQLQAFVKLWPIIPLELRRFLQTERNIMNSLIETTRIKYHRESTCNSAKLNNADKSSTMSILITKSNRTRYWVAKWHDYYLSCRASTQGFQY